MQSANEIERNRYHRLKDAGLCVKCGVVPARPDRTRCDECGQKQVEISRASQIRQRMRVYEAYGGPICACCGEIEVAFLSIDHMNGRGNEHRREINANCGQSMVRWLIKNDFPSGFQVLCYNCNRAKSFLGVCPHKETS